MTAIVEEVLKAKSCLVASSYIDDIYVSGEICQADEVRQHLRKFGLETKAAERLGDKDGVRVLGLRIDEKFNWGRDCKLPAVISSGLTRRALHSWIGELVGHYPVAGWLRVACGYFQRCTAAKRTDWDCEVSLEMQKKVRDVETMLSEQGDPVKGNWSVDIRQNAVLWVDASKIAIGVALEIGGSIVEDADWLRKEEDSAHIRCSNSGNQLVFALGVRAIHTDDRLSFSVWMVKISD